MSLSRFDSDLNNAMEEHFNPTLERKHADFAAGQYIGSIRNAAKKQYARDYQAWMLAGAKRSERVEYAGLSYMAAQAVRMTIAEFYPDIEEDLDA